MKLFPIMPIFLAVASQLVFLGYGVSAHSTQYFSTRHPANSIYETNAGLTAHLNISVNQCLRHTLRTPFNFADSRAYATDTHQSICHATTPLV